MARMRVTPVCKPSTKPIRVQPNGARSLKLTASPSLTFVGSGVYFLFSFLFFLPRRKITRVPVKEYYFSFGELASRGNLAC